MSDVGKSDLDVSLDWAEQLADADALEQRAGELERLARQIRTTALRSRVRIRRARCESIAQAMLDVGKRGCLGQPFVHPAGITLPNDGPEGNVGGREMSRPAQAVDKYATLAPPDAFATHVGKVR